MFVRILLYICTNNNGMLDEFRLNVFMAVAQERSFTKAAALLHISQPAVSQHISELERFLGTRMFERLRGETVLTPAGEVFRAHASNILREYNQINILFCPLSQSVVKVSASEEVYDYLTGDLLKEFTKTHPQVTFMKTFPDEADLQVSLIPDINKRGTFALSINPSESFATSKMWTVLSQLLKPALK